MVATYWQIGERITLEEQGGALRAAYGERALERLGQQLRVEFGRGFNKANRVSQSQFLCKKCSFSAYADYNAACNIRVRARAAVMQPMVAGIHNTVSVGVQLQATGL